MIASLPSLPAEVLWDISDYLSALPDRLALQFTSKVVQTKLGTRAFVQLQNARHGNDRWEWLKRLARDIPDQDVCNQCNVIHSPLLSFPRQGDNIRRPCRREYIWAGQNPIIPALIVRAALRRHRQGVAWDWLTRDMMHWRPLYRMPYEDGSRTMQVGCVFYDFRVNDNAEFVLETTMVSLNSRHYETGELPLPNEQTAGPPPTVNRDSVCGHVVNFNRRNSGGPGLRKCTLCLVEYWLGYIDLAEIGRAQVLKTWKQLSWQNSVFLEQSGIAPWYSEQLGVGDISGLRRGFGLDSVPDLGLSVVKEIERSGERMALLRAAAKGARA